MTASCRLAACLVSLWALIGAAIADPAFDYRISGPAVHDNLAVYFVHGNGNAGAAPLTLDQAVASGQAKLRWSGNETPVTVENVSDRSIFIPFATLLTGGLQDQVTGTSLVLPPHSGPVPLATFCVDPFRSTARQGEDPATLASQGLMFPGRMAKLAMLVDGPQSKAVARLRQSGIWWSIDTTRTALGRRLGAPVEPPRQVRWNTERLQDQVSSVMLAARQSTWLTSLPLALENIRLLDAEQTYADGIAADSADDIIGAVFAVNGSLDGAEIYQSHALFSAMWPRLLRAHAIEAIAAKDDMVAQGAPPSVPAVEGFLAAGEAAAARSQGKGQYSLVRDSDAAIYAETRTGDGSWVNRSFIARSYPADAAGAPEAAILHMLDAGQVDGRPLASLGDRAVVIMHRNPAGGWTSATHLAAMPWRTLYGQTGQDADYSMLAPALMGLAFFAFLFWLGAPPRRARRDRVVLCRFAAGDVVSIVAAAARVKTAAMPVTRVAASVPLCARKVGAALAMPARTLAAAFPAAARTPAVAMRAAGPLARHAALGHAAALADWYAGIPWGEIARLLGPAWPGNFGPPPAPA